MRSAPALLLGAAASGGRRRCGRDAERRAADPAPGPGPDVWYAVYQRRGDALSGVYSFGPPAAAQLQFRLCLHAAEQSAQNLRKGGASPGGPTA